MNMKERNLFIVRLIEHNLTVEEIAKAFDMTPWRIRQIFEQHQMAEKTAQTSQLLLIEIGQANDLDKKWPMMDLVNTLKLSGKPHNVLCAYFAGKKKKEISLNELVEAMMPAGVHRPYSFCMAPIASQKQLGITLYRQIIAGMDKVDFGEAFQVLWKRERMKINW